MSLPTPEMLRLDFEALPPGARAHVTAVYEVVYPVAAGETVTFPVSAHLTPILNLTIGRATASFADGTNVAVPPLVLSGPQAESYTATVYGPMRGFYVTFAPTGPLALLGVRRFVPLARLASLATLVRPALTEATRAFEHAVLAAPDFGGRIDALVAWFEAASATAVPGDLADARAIEALIGAVERTEGCVRVDALARTLGVSPATLRRRMAALGLPLKRLLDIVRLRAAVAFLHAVQGATWADAVDRYGYADQAHFIRAHRRLTGVPPTRWDDSVRGIDHHLGMEPAG